MAIDLERWKFHAPGATGHPLKDFSPRVGVAAFPLLIDDPELKGLVVRVRAGPYYEGRPVETDEMYRVWWWVTGVVRSVDPPGVLPPPLAYLDLPEGVEVEPRYHAFACAAAMISYLTQRVPQMEIITSGATGVPGKNAMLRHITGVSERAEVLEREAPGIDAILASTDRSSQFTLSRWFGPDWATALKNALLGSNAVQAQWAWISWCQGEHETAIQQAHSMLEHNATAEDRSMALRVLGAAAMKAGDAAAAVEHYEAALALISANRSPDFFLRGLDVEDIETDLVAARNAAGTVDSALAAAIEASLHSWPVPLRGDRWKAIHDRVSAFKPAAPKAEAAEAPKAEVAEPEKAEGKGKKKKG